MKKWMGLALSLLLALSLISTLRSHRDSERSIEKKEEGRTVLIQYREGGEKRGEKDSHGIQLLKELRQIVDGWLKSINEEIDREDVTRFKVRFLEILRSILEWVKEKLDSWVESLDEDVPGKREKSGPFREIRKRHVTFSGIG
jgi:hypothetical protein